jgi:chromosomal replication initiator protein
LIFKNQRSRREKPLTPKTVLEKVADYYRVNQSDIKGKKRQAKIVLPRQVIMYLLRKDLGMQLESIGAFLGNRDHTTIMHGVEKIETLLCVKNSTLPGEIKEIKSIFKNS